jgi:hypothetical protein
MLKNSSFGFSGSETHSRWPYHATAHGTSLIISSSGLSTWLIR